MVSWTTSAVAQQEQFLARLAAAGARIAPEYRFTKVVNGFSARLDPTSLALLDRDREVTGIFPVRIAYPAQAVRSEDSGVLPAALADLEVAGLDGTGVTVGAPRHRRRSLASVSQAARARRPRRPRPGERWNRPATSDDPGASGAPRDELAGIVAGTEGPDGLHGIAPGASILPVRVGGWQPNSEGGYSVYSRTDQILAGLEAAVDPNDDGDTHDAARIALIGMVEPYAAFTDGPLPRGIAGAAALDMLTIVPAGNDGSAGPAYGSIAGPGAARGGDHGRGGRRPGRDADRARPLRAGLRVLYEGDVPLGGAPSKTVIADVVPVDRRTAARGIEALFSDGGTSAVAGNAVLVPRGALSDETVEETTSAGALAVLVDGRRCRPERSASTSPRRARRRAHRRRRRRDASDDRLGDSGDGGDRGRGRRQPQGGRVDRGLLFARLVLDGSLKPSLAAPGCLVPTSEPGRGDDGDVRFGTISGPALPPP